MAKLEVPSKEEFNEKLGNQGGKVGAFFGVGTNGSINFTGIILIILVLPGVIYTFINFSNSIEYWKTVGAFITLGLGYLFGKHSNN